MKTASKNTFLNSRLISNLDTKTQDYIFEQSTIEHFDNHTIILEQDSIGTSFYILLEGAVQVLQKNEDGFERELSTLKTGDYFGEQSLLSNRGGRASATIKVIEQCRVMIISSQIFMSKIAFNKENRDIFDKTLLVRCPPISDLSIEKRQRIFEFATKRLFGVGQDIIVQNEIGDTFYIIIEGSVDVIHVEDGKEVHLVSLGPGAYFGEQLLLSNIATRRNATIRTNTECRVFEIKSDVFQKEIATSKSNIERFEKDASRHLYERVAKSLDAFASDEIQVSEAGVEKMTFSPGEKIVVEGTPSDCAYILINGIALVIKTKGVDFQELARMSSGQILGELGVLKNQPRAATVVAETQVEVLRIDRDIFIRWHDKNPKGADFFRSLSQVYSLSEGRKLNLFLGDIDGKETMTSVIGGPTTGVVSTRILNQGIVVFTNRSSSNIEGERVTLSFENDKLKRQIRGIVTSRKKDRVQSMIVYSVSAEGIENDLGTLYQHVSQLTEVQSIALRRFERTGFIGAEGNKVDRLCPCLGFSQKHISDASKDLGFEFEILRMNIGVGTLCGGCEPTVRKFLAKKQNEKNEESQIVTSTSNNEVDQSIQVEQVAKTNMSAKCPVDHTKMMKQTGYPLERLRRLLLRWDEDGDGLVGRDDVALRLRGLGVRNMDQFLDIVFPNALPSNGLVTIKSLVETISQTMDFDSQRMKYGPSYVAREISAQPLPKSTQNLFAVLRFFLRHRTGFIGLASVILLSSLFVIVYLATMSAGTIGLIFSIVLILLGIFAFRNWPGFRYYTLTLLRGESRVYSALFDSFGDVNKYATFSPLGPFGPKVFYVRCEKMVESILHQPLHFVRDSRYPLNGYPPFGVRSILWGGVDGVWLGYRSVCEEYFLDGYQEDVSEMIDIVKERVSMWIERGEIHLLDEIYRIALEIRARLFFQTTFDCYDDDAVTDFAALVDRVLSGEGLFHVQDVDVENLHTRVLDAVKGSVKSGSVGHSLRQCLENGELTEREVLHNAVMYVLAHAPTMTIFWALYRAAITGSQSQLRGDRKAIVRAIKEEMRLHPPVTSMFFRITTRDTTVEGIHIPKGSPIFVSPFLIHTNPELWENPHQFDDKRWSSLIGNAKEIVEPKTDPKDLNSRPCPRDKGYEANRYLPFGSGAHNCQGRFFASDEMLIVIDEILKMVDFEVVEDNNLLSRRLPEQVSLHVYSRPANDVRLRVRSC